MIIYLYVKEHSITGLKYFGKTNKNPFKYYGSGKYWISHVAKYGGRRNIKTIEVWGFDCIELLEQFAYEFSINNDIHNSSEWANLIPETGRGGSVIGRKLSDKTKLKISKSNSGRKRSIECRQLMSAKKTGIRIITDEIWKNRIIDVKESGYPKRGYKLELSEKWNKSKSGVKCIIRRLKLLGYL